MIYLASPYTNPDPQLRSRRFIAAREFCVHHMNLGRVIFSPIVYGHQFSRDFGHPVEASHWRSLNESLMQAMTELWVLRLPGWEASVGVQAEIEWAERLSIPLDFHDPLPYTKA